MGSHRETGETVAIKQMPKRTVRQSKVAQEIEILQQAGEHRNIIGFKDIFSDEVREKMQNEQAKPYKHALRRG